MSLHYLVKLEILIAHMPSLSCYGRKRQIYPTSTLASIVARLESSW